MKKNLMVGLWAGVYVAAMGAVLYIYKKSVDKQNEQYTAYIDAALPNLKKNHDNTEEEVEA